MIGSQIPVHFTPTSNDLVAMLGAAMAKCDREIARVRQKSFSSAGSAASVSDLLAKNAHDEDLCEWLKTAAVGAENRGYRRMT